MKPTVKSRAGSSILGWISICLAAQLSALSGSYAQVPGQIVVDSNPRWFAYHHGDPHFMAGPGDPEGFLYRGSLNPDGTRSGDQTQLIEKLSPSGANSIYLIAIRSHGGDGDPTQNPFVDNDPAKGLNQTVLDQWDGWFSEMDQSGIVIFFIFYDDGASIWSTGDAVGPDERAFVQAIVDRFEHHKHLIWVVAEEYPEAFTAQRVSALAAEIRAADDNDHPVAVHELSGLDFSDFADDPALDQFAIQYNVSTARDLHEGVLVAWDDAAGRYNLNLAEAFDWGSGAVSRGKAWAVAMAGAYVMAFGMDIETTSIADLEDLGRLRRFMEASDFPSMEPRDDLARDGTEYVLAELGKSFILYASQGTGPLGIGDLVAGTYRLSWLDTATGHEVSQDDVALSAGPVALGRPAGIGPEAAVYGLRLDGPNDPPVAHAGAFATVETIPIGTPLRHSDPDGPGPHTYAIIDPPASGSLSGVAPDLTYAADPGFAGVDHFTWRINDGRDDSNVAAVSVEVLSNQIPLAFDFTLFPREDTSVDVSFEAHLADVDGPGPNTYSIARPPDHGTVSLGGNGWSYTPAPGFLGTDTFDWKGHDGLDESNTATVTLHVVGQIFEDDFDRPDADTVGNGWSEHETDSKTRIVAGNLVFDAMDDPIRPLIHHPVQPSSSGGVVWTFDVNFERTGSEGDYALRLQLGEGSQMSESNPEEQGVAVNLVWGGPSVGLTDHEGLGHVVGGAVSQMAVVSGERTVTVSVDLDSGTYGVEVAGQSAQGIPLENPVAIDTVRFFTDRLNSVNFASREIDAVALFSSVKKCVAADGEEVVLNNDTIVATETWEACNSIAAGPALRIETPGDVTLRSGGTVLFTDGFSVGAGAALAVETDPSL